jgi:hypothetical protein
MFTNHEDGGQDLIIGFTSMDKIDLVGYGPNAIAIAIMTQTHSDDGSVTISLPDSTRVTFAGVGSLTTSDFITSHGNGGDPHGPHLMSY